MRNQAVFSQLLALITVILSLTLLVSGAFSSLSASAITFEPQVIGTLPVGDGPEFITTGGGHVFTSNRYDDSITVIDESTQSVIDTLQLPQGVYPRASIVVNNILYVGAFSGFDLYLFDATSLISLGTLSVGARPFAMTACGDELYVGNYSSTQVHVINTSTHTLATGFQNPIAGGLGATQAICAGDYVYLSNSLSNDVTLINRISHASSQSHSVGDSPLALGVANGSVFVASYDANTVSVLSASSGNLTNTINVGSNPSSVVVVGNEVYVANEAGDNINVIDSTTMQLATGYSNPISGLAGPHQLIVVDNCVYALNVWNNTISILNTDSHMVEQSIELNGIPYIGVSSGLYLYVTDNAADTVTIIQTKTEPVVPPTPTLANTGSDLTSFIKLGVLTLSLGVFIVFFQIRLNKSSKKGSKEFDFSQA